VQPPSFRRGGPPRNVGVVAPRYDTVSFLSDLGNEDEAAGVVRSVIRDLAPHVTTVDLTHDIAPFDVRAGSLALVRAIQYVASGVVLAVVDPGVGTARRAIAIEVGDGAGVLLGPDNGLLAPAVAMAGGAGRSVVLSNAAFHLAAPGRTFSARDIFAPVAAHLCNGIDLAEFGELVDPISLLPGVVPLSREDGNELVTEVMWVDHFGNAQLNIGPEEIEHWGATVRVRFGDNDPRAATRAVTFGEIGGGIGMVIDSHGMVTISLDRASAAVELGLAAGTEVRFSASDGPTGVTTPVAFPGRR
jgi:S-adenosyl-L-methionine hydrolase (adenosine-forming)